MKRLVWGVIAATLLSTGCAKESVTPAAKAPPQAKKSFRLAVSQLESPGGANSGEVFVAPGAPGRFVMSWLEQREGEKHELRGAVFENGKWSDPFVVVARDNFFVNWADFPSIVPGERGTLFAHWLEKSGSSKYQYDVHLTASNDGGKSWRESLVPHKGQRPSEYGFASLVPLKGEDRVALAWLDGRNMIEEGEGEMNLRYAEFSANGEIAADTVLDARVCECCQTGMTITSNGTRVVVYRDRSAEEVRDIGIVRSADGKFSDPALVHGDGWTIPGCPVNGPQIDSLGERTVVAWFTEAQQKPSVKVKFSTTDPATFGNPIVVSDGAPLGRVDIAFLRDELAAVAWLEQVEGAAEVRLQLVSPEGVVGSATTVAKTVAARSSGFPRLAFDGERLLLAWNAVEPERRVRTALITIEEQEQK